jgi:hypothetical protein
MTSTSEWLEAVQKGRESLELRIAAIQAGESADMYRSR